MTAESKIITAQSERERREGVLRRGELLGRIYEASPEVRKLADEIHSRRMMGGPACWQCIEMALARKGITIR